MTLSKKAQGIVAAIVALWLIAIAGLVAATSMTQAGDNSTASTAGSLERNIAGIEGMGLNHAALQVADVYGEEYIAAAIICSGQTTAEITQNIGIGETDLEPLNLGEEGVPSGASYIALMTEAGQFDYDKIDSSKLELCLTPLTGVFDTRSMLPLSKVEPGLWALFV